MERFKALEFKPHPHWVGVQARMDFPNGYTASVIRSEHSYGGDDGLYELAILRDGNLDYDTPITDDVLGHQTEADIDQLLGDILSLPNPN